MYINIIIQGSLLALLAHSLHAGLEMVIQWISVHLNFLSLYMFAAYVRTFSWKMRQCIQLASQYKNSVLLQLGLYYSHSGRSL